jgi:hypothetical protein
MRLAMVVKALLVGGGNAFQALDRAAGVAEDGGDGGEAIGRGFSRPVCIQTSNPIDWARA